MTPAQTLAAITAVQAHSRWEDHSEAGDGPDEPVIAAADLLDMADREEARTSRWQETAL